MTECPLSAQGQQVYSTLRAAEGRAEVALFILEAALMPSAGTHCQQIFLQSVCNRIMGAGGFGGSDEERGGRYGNQTDHRH
jgi:hypothetical protein